MNTIKLKQRLNIFDQADTNSELLGVIEQGKYELFELKKNYPNQDTDYALIFDSKQNKNVWICSRYKQTSYIIISANNDTVYDFGNDKNAIDEKALTDLLPDFIDFTYDLHKPAYPFQLRGCKVPVAPPAQNNCCTFVEALLVKAWENSIRAFSWDTKKHGQMMIYSAEDYYSPITCLVEQEMAVDIDNVNAEPHPWTVVQGWRDQWKGGHTFIILDYHSETDRVLTLESNAAYGLNGVGYRKIGNYANHMHPSATWWENESLWTWEKIKLAYKYRKLAKLKVNNVDWV